MDVAEFLAWDAPGVERWQLVDGRPEAMAPAGETHNIIKGELGALIGNHLVAMGRRCTLVPNAGVIPRIRSDSNVRIPDLAVTCVRSRQESPTTTDPVLLIEILSPSNRAETWANVWAYTTIPSVREILVLHSTAVRVEVLRRDADGNWPERAGAGRRHAGHAEHRAAGPADRRLCGNPVRSGDLIPAAQNADLSRQHTVMAGPVPAI